VRRAWAAGLAAALLLSFCSRGGESLFEDDFSNPSSGWTTSGDPRGLVEYSEGRLRFSVEGAAGAQSTIEGVEGLADLSDVTAEVDVIWPSGGVRFGGVVCRVKGDRRYTLSIDSDGTYGIFKRGAGRTVDLKYGIAPDIREGAATNRFRAGCAGDVLSLHVNGKFLASVVDRDFASGAVGLRAGAGGRRDIPETERAEVLFDEFVLRPATSRPAPSVEMPPVGREVFSGAFRPEGGWLSGAADEQGEGYEAAIADEALVIEITEPGAEKTIDSARVSAIPPHADVVVEADVSIEQRTGDPFSSYAGLACRVGERLHYLFLLYGDGSYGVLEVSGGGETIRPLAGGFDPAARTAAGKSARLRAVCAGDRLSLGLGERLLNEAPATTLGAGAIALVAGTDGDPPMRARFGRLRVLLPG